MPDPSAAPGLRRHWLHASGGLIWHWRALRYRNTMWRDFRLTVRGWLHDWQPPTDKLLIVGPSAGYSLDDEFLQRWKEVVALEPDPLARCLLRRRFPDVHWHFADMDVLGRRSENVGLLTKHFSGHAVLFANVLGQVTPRTASAAHAWHLALRKGLRTQHWASYHDVISTQRVPDAIVAQKTSTSANLDEVIGHFWHGGEIAVVDHCTFGLGVPGEHASEEKRDYCIWPLRPGHYHLVEWLQAAPAPAAQADAETPAGKDG